MLITIWIILSIVACVAVTIASAIEGADGEETIERVGITVMFMAAAPIVLPLIVLISPLIAIYYIVRFLSNR